MRRAFLSRPHIPAASAPPCSPGPARVSSWRGRSRSEPPRWGDFFTFCRGLYFRGKLTYVRRFTQPPPGPSGVQIIIPSRGLLNADTIVGPKGLSEFAGVPVDSSEPRFTAPLRRAAESLAAAGADEVILLGSVATGKYLDTLRPIFGERLLFPEEFASRGDMSRGALLLRTVAANRELRYGPVPV